MSNCVFNFSFLSLVLYEILGWSRIYIRGRCAPWMPPSGKISIYPNEYFGISNWVFNCNFLALVLSKYNTRGAYAPLTTPSGNFFCTLGEYCTISNCVFNISFLFLVFYEILGWSQIYIRGRSAPPGWLLAEKFFIVILETSTFNYFGIYNCVFNFNFLALLVCEMLGSQIYIIAPCAP